VDTIIAAIFANPLTLGALSLAAIALIITSFARGWIVSRYTVETMLGGYKGLVDQANIRAADYKEAWELSEAARKLDSEHQAKLLVYAEAADKVLQALPVTYPGVNKERTDK
jgi:hypothetical protein